MGNRLLEVRGKTGKKGKTLLRHFTQAKIFKNSITRKRIG